MSRFLFLVLSICFYSVFSAPYTLTGELQVWSQGDLNDFGRAEAAPQDINANYFGTNLNLFGKPTYAGVTPATVTSAASFAEWWGTPFSLSSRQNSLYPYSIVMDDKGGGVFEFNRTNFNPYPNNGTAVSFFSFHVRTEVTLTGATAVSFQSSDDFAVYVGGTLACQQTGYTNGVATPKPCTLTAVTSGSAPSQYVDIFYARRSTASSKMLWFQLVNSNPSVACSIFSRSILTRGVYPFVFGPSSVLNIQPLNGATISPGTSPVARLLAPGQVSAAQSLYSNVPIRYRNGLSIYFKFNYTGGQLNNTEGFAVVLQTYQQSAAEGTSFNLGYNFPKSLVIEFDTNQNSGCATDGPAPHVEIRSSLSATTATSACAATPSHNRTTARAAPVPNLLNGSTYEVLIEYVPPITTSATLGTVTVWIGTNLASMNYHSSRFTSPNFVAQGQFLNSDLVNMFGSNVISVGFTTAAGSTNPSTNLYIWDWRVWSVPAGAFQSVVSPSSGWSSPVARNNQGSASFTVALEDACGSPIPIGTDTVTAQLQNPSTGAVVGNTAVQDLGTGSYSIWFWHTVAANYSLFVNVYHQPIVQGSVSPYWDQPFPITIVPDVISAPNSFYTPLSIGTIAWMAGLNVQVNVTARDQFNNSVFTPSTGFSMFFSSQPSISHYAQVGDTYLFNLSTTVAATGIKIFVRYLGTDVAFSPTQTLSVSAGFPPDAQQTAVTLIGGGLQGSTAGAPQNIDFQCKDTWGNTLSNLTGISLNVTMACLPGYTDSRCASANVVNITTGFGPLGNSWFRVTWVTPVVGPCYSLNIEIRPATGNNYLLPNVPNVCVLPNVTSGTTSLITATQTSYPAGSQGIIFIQARDAFLNNRTGPNASPFQVKIGFNTTVTCGGAGGSGLGIGGALCVYNQGGIYQVSFTPTLAGNHTVTVINPVNEGCATTNGFCNVSTTITVGPGPAYAPNDVVQGLANPVIAGVMSTANVTSKDEWFNDRPFDADAKNFVITIIPQGQTTSTATIGALTPLRDGLYKFDWGCTVAATYDVNVKLLGTPVQGQPLTTVCLPSYTNLSQSTVSGPGVLGGIESTNTYFDLRAIDSYGNPTNGVWQDTVDCDICFQTTCPNSTFACSAANINAPQGIWRINYTVPPYIPQSSSFTLRLRLTPNLTNTEQLRTFTLYSTASGTTLYAVIFQTAARTGCSVSTPNPPLGQNYDAGTLSYLYLANYDGPGCTPTLNLGVNEPSWSVEFNGPVKFSGTVSLDPATTGSAAVYNVSFTPTKIGNYTVIVRGQGIETQQSLNGLFVTVSPGPIDPPSCTISAQAAPVVAGNSVTFNMTLFDQYKNRLTTSTPNTFTIKVLDSSSNDVTAQSTVVFDNGDNVGFVSITITPTKAGVGSFLVYANDATTSNLTKLIGSRSYSLTVLPGPVSELTTCFWVPYNGTMCPSNPAPTATAGTAFTVPLYARDRFNNEINNNNLSFSVDLTNNPTVATRTSVFLGSNGLYSVTFQANKTVSAGTLGAIASAPSGLKAATTTLTVQPAELSNVTSFVTGLMSNYSAGDFVNWTLHATDIYGNAWFDNGAAQIDVTLSGPENAVKSTALVGNGFIKSDFLNPGALYNYAYLPVTASTNTLPTPLPYMIKFIYNGVELDGLTGNMPFLVYPGAPYAPNTVIPQLVTPLIPAGQMTNITVSLQDVYGNWIRQGGTPVMIQFYQGQGATCSTNGSLDASRLVSNFTNRRGYISLDESNYVTDNGNGNYTVTIWSVVADYYFASLWVGGNQTVPCRSIQTVFQIVPLAIDGSNSLISLPVDAVADGKTQSVNIVLRDRYDNLIRTGGASLAVGLTPGDNPNICPSGSPPLLQNITNQASITRINDNNNGSYTIDFTVFKAQTYSLVVTVNVNSSYNGDAIGRNCLNLTISPWYVYTWTYNLTASIFEALPTVLIVNPKDFYGNDVLTGAHFWRLVVNRETLDVLAPYRFAFPTPKSYPYDAVYNAEHFGNFTATLRLVQDPKYSDPTLYPVASVTSVVDLSVTAATCNRETGGAANYRCPDYTGATLGSCVSDWNSCPAAVSGGNTCSGTNCGTYCAGSNTCATGLTGNQRICPDGWVQCNTGPFTCSRNTAVDCPAPPSCPTGFNTQCPNGACVKSSTDCPTGITCASSSDKVCPDGTCVASGSTCPSLFLCFAPNSFRCPDGSCRPSQADCPSDVTCLPGWVRCDTGHCVMSASECAPYQVTCAANQVRCPGGECRDNRLLCPTGITCPSNRPVLCADRSCVETVGLCRTPAMCTNASLPYRCPDGTCSLDASQCPTLPTCTFDTPVLCEDRTCKSSLSLCVAPRLGNPCPDHRPYNCPDGTCASSRASCPTVGICTADTPVRCNTAGCAVASNVCPVQADLPCPGVVCPGGGCAPSLAQCPTLLTCPPNFVRCADGSCRRNCSSNPGRNKATYCAYPLYDCPGQETGFSCSDNPAECPQSVTCPSDRPVRCVDRTCAISIEYCKPEPSYGTADTSAIYYTCPANTWLSALSGASCDGPASTTCPSGWVKCWDETCRIVAEDCPQEPKCVVNSPDPKDARPYLCSDGTCARYIYNCQPPPMAQCSAGQVRCPAVNASGPGSNILCANSLSECVNVMAPPTFLKCPNNYQLCKNGACMTTCPKKVTCPSYLPTLCPDGKCVQRMSDCANKFGCPPEAPNKCWDGSCRSSCPQAEACPSGLSRCPDGSCQLSALCDTQDRNSGCPTTNTTRCWDKSCPSIGQTCNDATVLATAPINVCPLHQPYRCPNGFCAKSSTRCPGFPMPRSCSTNPRLVLCADGSCQKTWIQCPLIQPCPPSYVRCNNTACMPSKDLCPAYSVCASDEMMCDNGLCASNTTGCFNENTGCWGTQGKCADGTCVDDVAQCPPVSARGDGCPLNTKRCWDGSCGSSCPAISKNCNPADPAAVSCSFACPSGQFVCADGSCVTDATQCNTAWNCPIAAPYRSVNGTCFKYPADGTSDAQTAPANGVVVCSTIRPYLCADGSCVDLANHCPSFSACPSGTSLCQDMTCAATCPTRQLCPPGSPTLCLDGSCRKTNRECGQLVQANRCPAPWFQCFDGFCAKSPLVCIERQSMYKGVTFSANNRHDTICSGTENLCWNGACLKTPTGGALSTCPILPGCPADFPMRCDDGSCVNETVTPCNTTSTCASGTKRCEDGSCRPTCPVNNGCPRSAPFYCSYGRVQCVANRAACLFDSETPQVCGENCYRDIPARSQKVSISLIHPTSIDVSVNDYLVPMTQIYVPPAAFGAATAVNIWPSAFSTLQNGRARVNAVLVDKTPGEIILSTPFMIQVEGRSSVTAFPINATVQAAIDVTQYYGSIASADSGPTNPCQWVRPWTSYVEVDNGTNTFQCGGTFNVTETNILFDQPQRSGCNLISWTTKTTKVTSNKDLTTGIETQCVCGNITADQSNSFGMGTLVCVLFSSDPNSVTYYNTAAKSGSCPAYGATGTDITLIDLDQLNSTSACTGSASGLIQPNDICLGYFNPGIREWQCVYSGYYDRLASPPWFQESGNPFWIATANLPFYVSGYTYAFLNIPLPEPPASPDNQESWWQKYGKIVLGVTISMFIVLLILAYAISRLIRYRRKYQEEKAEVEELREQAQELDRDHGGLGVYDEEVEMMANPLVVQMQELQKKLEETNAHLKTQEERDETQMASLDKERQRILEEIKRVKDELAKTVKNNPTRVDDVPTTSASVGVTISDGGVSASASVGVGERQDFGQTAAKARRKQDF